MTAPATPTALTDEQKAFLNGERPGGPFGLLAAKILLGDRLALLDLLLGGGGQGLSLADSKLLVFGDGSDITVQWNGSALVVGQAAANSAIQWGASGAGIDMVFYGDTAGYNLTWDQSADSLIFSDNAKLVIGSGSDDIVLHDGASTTWTHATGAWTFDNTGVTSTTKFRLGTDTNATAFGVYNDSDVAKFRVFGDGTIEIPDGSVVHYKGAGAGAGDVIQRFGGTATEGLELCCIDVTVSPAAVETAIATVPAGSFILSVQSNVQAALTGGGTTVTYGIGIAADPDKYGTPAADSLAKNTKTNFMGPFAFLASAEPLVLTGAATGGGSDGNTALTVGSVRVRVLYYTCNGLDDAP